MAFRGGIRRKDVKKQSYYVWFLGAKESKGLRGDEYIRPVLEHLVDREREVEPTKVTLQVSSKGVKIVQYVPRGGGKGGGGKGGAAGKTEQIKHFIPHHAVTCAMQERAPNDDVVCCILLIYNPLTRCPVHVHAYRCDSPETAATLRAQLQALVDRPENQKKFREIESRLAAKGLLPSSRSCLGSDGRSTRTEGSDRTEDSTGSSEKDVGVRKEHIANLYDSLAAELRERLNNPNSCPILLPPRDYDTVSRSRGRLEGIEARRSTNYSLVGLAKVAKPPASQDSTSGKSSSNKSSSGIGSDEALSSAIQEVASHPDFESKEVDPNTSSEDEEEDWPRDEEDFDDEDEPPVVPTYEWRRQPLRISHQPHPPPMQQQLSRDRRSRSSPDEEDDPRYPRHTRAAPGVRGIVDKFERRGGAASPPSGAAAPARGAPIGIRRSDPYADRPYGVAAEEEDSPRGGPKHFEVVYRRHSNPPEKSRAHRDARPVSYPAAAPDPVSPRPAARAARPPPEPMVDSRPVPKYKVFGERAPPEDPHRHLDHPHHRYVERHSPSHLRAEADYYRDSRPVSSSPAGVRQFRSPERQCPSPHEVYPRLRQGSAVDLRQGSAFPSRFVEPYPGSRPAYHAPPSEERRRSGYFDLPVDPRDYRHSFVESPFRRLPLNTQY